MVGSFTVLTRIAKRRWWKMMGSLWWSRSAHVAGDCFVLSVRCHGTRVLGAESFRACMWVRGEGRIWCWLSWRRRWSGRDAQVASSLWRGQKGVRTWLAGFNSLVSLCFVLFVTLSSLAFAINGFLTHFMTMWTGVYLCRCKYQFCYTCGKECSSSHVDCVVGE